MADGFLMRERYTRLQLVGVRSKTLQAPVPHKENRAEGPRARGGELGVAFALAWHKMKRPCDAMSSREGKS